MLREILGVSRWISREGGILNVMGGSMHACMQKEGWMDARRAEKIDKKNLEADGSSEDVHRDEDEEHEEGRQDSPGDITNTCTHSHACMYKCIKSYVPA